MGASTLGAVSSFQYIRTTMRRKAYCSDDAKVIQICWITPLPAMSAMTAVAPGAISIASRFAPVRSQLDARRVVPALRA